MLVQFDKLALPPDLAINGMHSPRSHLIRKVLDYEAANAHAWKMYGLRRWRHHLFLHKYSLCQH